MAQVVRRRRLMGEINVVPYIDVMLVLLIIFMITAPLLTQGVKVDLPQASADRIDEEFLAKHEPLIVTVDRSGRLYFNMGKTPDQPTTEATIATRVAAVLRRDAKTPVLVRADTHVPYGNVVHAMVMLQKAGAAKVGLLTDPEPAPGKQRRQPAAVGQGQ